MTPGRPTSAYSVGIDLGTTHTVVAYAPVKSRGAGDTIKLFDIDQLVAPGEVAARHLLPSLRYHPLAGELAAGDTTLPWPAARVDASSAGATSADATHARAVTGAAPDAVIGPVIGRLARQLGAQVPGRLVASAKSWLSHAAVDRLAPILPWGAAAEVPKVSPVAASASYLAHVRAAWNHRHPKHPLELQELVLTVPASFDDVARELTLTAARDAGLPTLRLLEEPQAALYDWLFRHRRSLAADLHTARLVLVCDVGGGTTDLSLVRIDWSDGEPSFERVAVGRHLMLGGDNMDLALANLVETRLVKGASDGAAGGAASGAAARLPAGQLSLLVERCRAVKERLLANDAPASAAVTLLGGGSRLIGGARSVELTRDEVERIVVDGFFPQGAADEAPRRERASGLVAFGLPYASDAAVTRHIAGFLQQHTAAGWPDALLLNGGVFRADAIAARLHDTLAAWRGAPLLVLHNADPDVAVARGAVAHALARRGGAPTIGGGSPRSYFLRLDAAGASAGASAGTPTHGAAGVSTGTPTDAATHAPINAPTSGGAQRGVCVLPHGSETGCEVTLDGRTFALRVGEPVQFHLMATTASGASGEAAVQAGDVLDLAALDLASLPPLATVVRAAGSAGAAAGSAAGGMAMASASAPPRQRDILVQLAATLTEVGTLDLHCVAVDDPGQRWKLAFQLRGLRDDAAVGAPQAAHLPPRLNEARDAILRVFGARDREVGPKAVKQLRTQLEALLGNRERWPTAVLRPLFDALMQGARGRRRSADHERLWLSLAGWCLRPGYGVALDAWRIEQLWPLFEAGVQHGHEAQVNAEWWTLWRRVAGGLDEAAQQRLLQDFALNLRGDEAGITERPPRLVKGGWDDMVRLGASLERIRAEHKAEIGDWLVERLRESASTSTAQRIDVWTPWAIGRIGARAPLYGSAHTVVAVEHAVAWLEALLALDWKRVDGAAAAAANLARLSGDRTRDLPPEVCERVLARLEAHHAPATWLARIREVVALDEAGERSVFGEALPPGLKLIR